MRNKKRIYTFTELRDYTSKVIENSTEISPQDSVKDKEAKGIIKKYIEDCFYGIESEKEFVKMQIKRLIQVENTTVSEYPKELHVNEVNVNDFFNAANQNAYGKFLILMHFLKQEHEGKVIEYMLKEYKLNNHRNEFFYIDNKDIEDIFENEIDIEKLTYKDKLNLIVQLLYEDLYGMGVIDELYYQEVDEISLGVSGKPENAHESIWVKINGLNYHFRFLKFENPEVYIRIIQKLGAYKQKEQFTGTTGHLLAVGKDGSRRTLVRPPMGRNFGAFIRKYTKGEEKTNRELLIGSKAPKGWEYVEKLERYLIRGGLSMSICGAQGAGKTTKLEAILEHAYPFLSIRPMETEFEAKLNERYPDRNIYGFQQIQDFKADKIYDISLRTSADIIVPQELRDDAMTNIIIKSANRGSRQAIFTYHPNTPEKAPLEMANAMLTMKTYSNLKDALYAVLESVNIAIQIHSDITTGDRYYSIYEFIPKKYEIDDSFLEEEGEERSKAYEQMMLTAFQKMTNDDFYKTVPIVEYDFFEKKYVIKNELSKKNQQRIIRNLLFDEEREEFTDFAEEIKGLI